MADERHTHILNLLPAYALDSLDDEELILVTEHLAGCARCQAELQAYEAVVEQLALAVPNVALSSDLEQRLLARIQAPSPISLSQPKTEPEPVLTWRQKSNRYSWSVGPIPYLQAALVLLILILLTSNLILWRRVSQLELNTEPGRMQAIRLNSTGVYPEANGFLLVSADGLSGAIVVDELPQLDEAETYQLWLIRNGKSSSGATLSVDEFGYGGARVRPPEPLFNYTSAIITIEPADGSLYPTSDQLLSAPLFDP